MNSPIAVELKPLAVVPRPIAVELIPLAVFPVPPKVIEGREGSYSMPSTRNEYGTLVSGSSGESCEIPLVPSSNQIRSSTLSSLKTVLGIGTMLVTLASPRPTL